MKRLRDEVYMNPQFKRPFGMGHHKLLMAMAVRWRWRWRWRWGWGGGGGGVGVGVGVGVGGGSSNGGGTGVTGSGTGVATTSTQKLTTNDALSYLKQVKDMFQDQREKYDRFLDVMKDFKAQRIDTAGVIARVKELFKGHPNLILGFNTFLPKVMKLPSLMRKRLHQKGQNVFQNDDHVYKSFLDILNMYRKEHKGITEVYQEVAALFDDHPDLLDEFTRFLPDTSATASAPHASFGRHSFHRYDERSSALPTMRQSHIDKQRPRRDRVIDPNGEWDLSVERPDMDDDKTVMKLHKEQKKHNERENRDRRNRDQDDRDPDTENNGDISMHRLSDKKKSARKVEDFGGNSNLASYDDKDALKSMYSHEFTFCEKVKERLRSADDYQAFLKCLHIYSTEIITRKELQSLVADLLGKYPDLMEGFNEFLERCERIDGFLAGVMGKTETLWNEGNSSKALRIDEKEKEQKREVEGGKRRIVQFEILGKAIQELDLSNCQRCTPSYRLLPEDYPISSASQRSELGAQVLNDHWVSVTSGSEDYSFKHMRRNQYEESLFRLKMIVCQFNSQASRELLNSINNNSIGSDGPIRIEDHFTATRASILSTKIWLLFHKSPLVAFHLSFGSHVLSCFLWTALVAEIKEIKEKRQKEDDVLLSIAAGSRHSIIPNMEFEYADTEVHEDVFRIIKYSCEEVCSTKDQVNKVLRFWTTFLEPMLVKNTTTNVIESEGSPNADATTTNLKQPKSNCNGDSSTSPQRVNFSRSGFMNVDTLAKEGLAVASGERLTNPDIAVTSGPDVNHGRGANSSRVSNGPIEEGNEANQIWKICSPQRLNQLTNGEFVEASRLSGYNEDSVDPCKNEKEEGELSPNGDFEDNFGAYQDSSLQALPEKNRGNEGMQGQMGSHEEICADAAGENDVDADDEDSENISEAGEDVSGSESAADECSREEPEEEEDGEHDDLDGKAESEGEAENTSEAHYHGGDGALVPQSERFLLTCKPLSKHVASPLVGDDKKGRRVFYGNDTFYVLFRLHQTLYERILSAKVNSVSGESKWRTTKDASSDPYARFMSALFSLLDGSSDNTKFEDDCRSWIGNQSYVLFTLDKLIYMLVFTLDKLIYKLVKQLQTVSSDEVDCKLLQLYEYEKSRKPEKYVDSVYYENVHVILHDENIYRLQCTSTPARLSIQLMDDGNEKSEVVAVSVDPNFATYLHNDYLSVNHGKKESSAIMLKRNMCKYGNLDESTALCRATEKVLIMNGLECKMAATSSKISYVLDTEDFFIRLGRRRNRSTERSLRADQARVQRFHQFLAASMI
ncbi:hypothetical protein Pfo_030151 [Paulownia fortunei]|nr:hypothetical protein Pfo_030151 [Paulownia fortunei]